MADVPPSLKPIKKYLEQGKTVDNPVVAYHCRLFALQQAMKMRSKIPKEDMGFIMTLMDECEKEKGGLGFAMTTIYQCLFSGPPKATHIFHNMHQIARAAWEKRTGLTPPDEGRAKKI